MARQPRETDYTVTVENVGTFTFAKRTMRDEIDVQVEFARIINGVEPTAWLEAVGGWMSTLRVLTVRAPDGWDLDGFDPFDPETYAKLRAVHSALVEKERSFRLKPAAGSEGTGQASS